MTDMPLMLELASVPIAARSKSFTGQFYREALETGVAFRSAKEPGFRGAKGDIPTAIDSSDLRCFNDFAIRFHAPWIPIAA